MGNFTLEEIQAAELPLPAFEVSLIVNVARNGTDAKVRAVTIVATQGRTIQFIDDKGVHCHADHDIFFKTRDEAQADVNAFYDVTPTQAMAAELAAA